MIIQERDLIGRVYEYFLQAFAINANKEDGEFYTPKSIVELIATFVNPMDGTLYDPCCGSGGMFVQCAKFVEKHGGNSIGVNVFGQESDPTTFRLAKMNLAVRGITYHLGERHASTFTHDMHRGLTFDYIMANPPFNLKKWYESSLEWGEAVKALDESKFTEEQLRIMEPVPYVNIVATRDKNDPREMYKQKPSPAHQRRVLQLPYRHRGRYVDYRF